MLDGNDVGLVVIALREWEPSVLELVTEVRATDADMPLIVVGPADGSIAVSAVDAGADEYVARPADLDQIMVSVRSTLRRKLRDRHDGGALKRLDGLMKERARDLWEAIRIMERTKLELRRSNAAWADRMLRAAAFKDDETPDHIERMSRYCALLAELVTDDSLYAETVRVASQLHDVGKIGIPDEILLKQGSFTAAERATMQTHAVIGYDILGDAGSEIADLAATIALTHHERWDGTGYPGGLAGAAIPLEGRIAAIADAFDALTTNRIYRRAASVTAAIEQMKAERARQFDPELLELFLEEIPAVLDILGRYPDARCDPRRSPVVSMG